MRTFARIAEQWKLSARDAMALLAVLHARQLGPALSQAAALVATVVGQDLEQDTDGVFRIARKVAPAELIVLAPPGRRRVPLRHRSL